MLSAGLAEDNSFVAYVETAILYLILAMVLIYIKSFFWAHWHICPPF